MKAYENFKVAAYVFAYYIEEATDEEILRGIEYFKKYIHLSKVYLENHRSVVDIPVERMKHVKKLFEDNGIEVSGGITSTVLVDGIRKPAIFDSFCYTDPAHRAKYLQVVKDTSPHRYVPLVSRAACEKQERKSFLDRVYQGSAGRMVAAFVRDGDLSEEEVAELRNLLEGLE